MKLEANVRERVTKDQKTQSMQLQHDKVFVSEVITLQDKK